MIELQSLVVVAILMVSPAGPAGVAPASAQSPLCDDAKSLPLNLSAAARTPALKDGKVSTLGVDDATALASQLTVGADPCDAPASPETAKALTAADAALASGDRAEAQRLIRAAIAEIKSRRPGGFAPAPIEEPGIIPVSEGSAALDALPPPAGAGACAVSRDPKISPKDDKRIGDALKAGAAAQKAGDQQGAADAQAAAGTAFNEWANGAMTGGGATTVGDYLVIAKGAQMLGQEGTYDSAMDGARKAATRDIKQSETAFDPCTVSTEDLRCVTNAVATGQLLGAAGADDLAASSAATMKAIEDRLAKKQVDDCEEWSFSMRLTALPTPSLDTEWTLNWLDSRIRVNRKLNKADASRGAGYSQEGWPGLIGDASGNCYEEVDGVRKVLGPAAIKGGAFHYSVQPVLTDAGMTLTLASPDANFTMDAPRHLGCQALKFLGELIVKRMLHGPFPLEIPVAAGQTDVTLDETDEGTKIHISLRRIM